MKARKNGQAGSTTLPRAPPTHQQPANGNKQPHGTMSIGCARLFRLGLALQVVSAPAKSFHAQASVLDSFLVAYHQRAAESALRLPLDSISDRQYRSTSLVF